MCCPLFKKSLPNILCFGLITTGSKILSSVIVEIQPKLGDIPAFLRGVPTVNIVMVKFLE